MECLFLCSVSVFAVDIVVHFLLLVVCFLFVCLFVFFKLQFLRKMQFPIFLLFYIRRKKIKY